MHKCGCKNCDRVTDDTSLIFCKNCNREWEVSDSTLWEGCPTCKKEKIQNETESIFILKLLSAYDLPEKEESEIYGACLSDQGENIDFNRVNVKKKVASLLNYYFNELDDDEEEEEEEEEKTIEEKKDE
jgi:hypothetical protein